MKIQGLFLLLPCIAAFFWYLAFLLFSSKGEALRRLKQFLFIVSLFLLFTLLSLNEESRLLLHFTLFKQVCALLLIPYFLKYIKAFRGSKPFSVFHKILSVVPYIQLIVGIESVYSVGFENALGILIDSYSFQGPMFPYLDNSQRVFYAGYTYMFRAFLLADFLLFSVGMMSCAISGNCRFSEILSFYFKGGKAPLKPVQYLQSLLLFLIIVAALILGKNSYIENIALAATGSLAIAFLVSMIAFVGTVGTTERNSVSGILRAVRFGDKADAEDVEEEDDEAVVQPAEEMTQPEVKSLYGAGQTLSDTAAVDEETMNRLREELGSRLEQIVEAEKLFLKRDLTLTAVSDRLGVFKDELSDFIDYKYGLSFQNYINRLRINYAEQYILNHDDVTQKEIALACGFSGASSFNSAFSKQNGVTPKIWKDRQMESLRNKEA